METRNLHLDRDQAAYCSAAQRVPFPSNDRQSLAVTKQVWSRLELKDVGGLVMITESHNFVSLQGKMYVTMKGTIL